MTDVHERLRVAYEARDALAAQYRWQAARLLGAAATLERSSPVELADARRPVAHLHSSCWELEDALDAALTAL